MLELAILENAIQTLEASRRELVSLYLDVMPYDPGYEDVVASSPVPAQYGELSRLLHITHDHLLNLREEIKSTTLAPKADCPGPSGRPGSMS